MTRTCLWKPVANARTLRIAGCLFAFALLASPSEAQEFELRAADLRVVGDARWSGGGWGGYHPIRLEITNFGPGRDLELRFEPHDRGQAVPTVRRRVRVEQNATARVTLSVPLVGGDSGRLEFLVGAAPVQGLHRDLSLMPPDGGGVPAPSLLVISPDAVDTGGFEQAAFAASQEWNVSGVPSSHVLGSPTGAGDVRQAVVGPSLLPASWVDYSALDLVAIRLDTLAALRPDERAALLDWAAAGGRLIVHRVGGAPAESEELGRLLGKPAEPKTWQPADPTMRQTLPMIFRPDADLVPNEGNPMPSGGNLLPLSLPAANPPSLPLPPGNALEAIEQLGRLLRTQPAPQRLDLSGSGWPVQPTPFAARRFGFGHIVAVSEDVFSGTGADWAWLLRAVHGPATAWPIRNGLSSGSGDIQFINLPIPGVRGVPAIAFLTLITLFAIAIGPANYFLLWRKKRLSRLVLTVPTIAAVTSILLFSYAAVAHGFGTKARVRSVTLIDPTTNSATSVSRLALFSGLAPSRGLVFSKETAVFPLLPYGEEFSDGEVDWTDAQGLTAGWLKSRTRTQFVTLTHRDERGRLTVTPASGGLRVVNGFSAPFRYLVVTGQDGTPYFGRSLAAGGEAVLKPLTEDDWTAIRQFATDRAPEPPEGVDEQDIMTGLSGGRPWTWFRQGWKPEFRQGLLERHLDRLVGTMPQAGKTRRTAVPAGAVEPVPGDMAIRADVVDPLAGPRGFLAVVDGDLGIDLGGLDVEERDSVHVLMGTW